MEGTELRAARHGLGLTQRGLALAIGVSANTIARWERGEVRISHPLLLGLALELLLQGQAAKADSETY